MRIFFDENFSKYLTSGMSSFQNGRKSEGVEVYHIAEYFGKGAADDVWIPQVAKMHGVIITQDLNIHRTQYLNDLCKEYKIGVFFFKPPSKKGYLYWEWVEQIVMRWKTIKNHATSEKRPFSFMLKPRSAKFSPL